jgi:predicted N-acetyltransferase YhbS
LIEYIAEPDLTAPDEGAIAQILADSFPTDFGGRSFYQQRPQARMVCRVDGVIAHLAIHHRVIRVGAHLVTVQGIGDVATHPDARGQGFATQLLEAVIDRATASSTQFLMLIGRRGLYDRAGFVPVPNRYRYVDMTGAQTKVIDTETSPFLHVRPVGDMVWDGAAALDLLGHKF